MIDGEGSELLAELFNCMTKKQKLAVPKPMCDRISRFMVDNGYRFVFGRWYLQAEPRTSNASLDRPAASAGTVEGVVVPRELWARMRSAIVRIAMGREVCAGTPAYDPGLCDKAAVDKLVEDIQRHNAGIERTQKPQEGRLT